MSTRIQERLAQLSPQRKELLEKLRDAGELTPARKFRIFHQWSRILTGTTTSLRSIPFGALIMRRQSRRQVDPGSPAKK